MELIDLCDAATTTYADFSENRRVADAGLFRNRPVDLRNCELIDVMQYPGADRWQTRSDASGA